MKSVAISLALGLAAGAASLAVAQDRSPASQGTFPDRGRSAWTQDDRAALMDGRIAGLRAALKLSPEQEKLWPPVEQVLRENAKQRADAWTARRERWSAMRGDRAAGTPRETRDIPAEIRARADGLTKRADSMRKLADASTPLYAALDDGQKRRLGALMRMAGSGGMRGHR